LRKEKLKPLMEIVFETNLEEVCKKKEIELIEYYSNNGCNLTNASCGGELGIYSSEYLPNNSIITFEEFFKYKEILENENIPILEISKKYNISKQTLYKLASGKLYNHKFGNYKVIRPNEIISNNKKLSGEKIKNTHYSNSKYVYKYDKEGKFIKKFNSISFFIREELINSTFCYKKFIPNNTILKNNFIYSLEYSDEILIKLKQNEKITRSLDSSNSN
jgi:hypothetical protein